jgi:hypothetical protein
MNGLFESILKIQTLLGWHGIPSIVIGGIAVGSWGEPRVTRDVDLKILLGRQDSTRLLSIIHPEYLVLSSNPEETLRKQALIFIQDREGTRLDILLADTQYDVLAIERGRLIEISTGIRVRVCSPEDLIIYKMISTRLRDHEDVKSIILRQGNALDDQYILNWLKQFEQALDDSTMVTEYQRLRGR